ncbi:HIT-like domain-containing protein [Lipomyces japonicus]|uniref:HIT-like domain-containing protein n=1 Tax=Lipomyces japonicus TaxID=56871 RepID=UPI0034CDA848
MSIHFGQFVVTQQVFFRSKHSYGLVNLKPLLPGHVLVCPYRVVSRVSDLSDEEAADFFLAVKKVSGVIEKVYDAQALNIAIQDGPLAGQSVPHVHCHIIPRKFKDLPNVDDIYQLIDSKDGDLELSFQQMKNLATRMPSPDVPDSIRQPRTLEDMVAEAQLLESQMKARL